MKTQIMIAAIMGMTSVFAADGVRYKDRIFDVSDARTVTVAYDVPTMDKSNYNILSELMVSFKMEKNMLHLYESEQVVMEPVVMDIYEPVNDNGTDRAAVVICHGGAFVASAKDDFDQKSVAYADSLAAYFFCICYI